MEEKELKDAVSAICQRFGVKGFLLVFLDGEKARFTGDMNISALAPIITQIILKQAGAGNA